MLFRYAITEFSKGLRKLENTIFTICSLSASNTPFSKFGDGMSETNATTNTTTTAKSTTIDVSLDGSADNIEKLVEFTKKISEQDMKITSLEQDNANYKTEIEKYKSDIARLQKVIADNFIATTEKPKPDMPSPKSFSDAYKEFISENSKKN